MDPGILWVLSIINPSGSWESLSSDTMLSSLASSTCHNTCIQVLVVLHNYVPDAQMHIPTQSDFLNLSGFTIELLTVSCCFTAISTGSNTSNFTIIIFPRKKKKEKKDQVLDRQGKDTENVIIMSFNKSTCRTKKLTSMTNESLFPEDKSRSDTSSSLSSVTMLRGLT